MKASRVLRLRSAATILVLALVCLAPVGAQISTDFVFPGETWQVVTRRDLQAYGWSADALQKTTAYVRDEANTTGLVVIDRGRVVYRYGDVEELSYVASVRKSILAMLYGYWVENGTIKLDTTLEQLNIDDIGGLLPIEKQATIEDVITARSGVYHPASYGGDDLACAPPRGSRKPGTYMLYSNWDFNVAGAIFEQLTKRDIYDELQSQLAIPLQFEDWDRSAQGKGGNLTVSKYPAYPIWVSTRDMARLGYLMLREGQWNGRQVIPRDWARKIVSVVTPIDGMNPHFVADYFGYGYMWWLWDGPKAVGPFKGAYTTNGAWGQWITVFPSLDLVIAHKTHNVYGRTTSNASWQRIIELLFEAKGVKLAEPFPWAQRLRSGIEFRATSGGALPSQPSGSSPIGQTAARVGDPVTGTWKGFRGRCEGQAIAVVLEFDGKTITGTITGTPQPGVIRTGTYDPGTGALKLDIEDNLGTIVFDGIVKQDAASGFVMSGRFFRK
jgi:CubicO group peptidase (beta-lactamase class C family)